MLLTHWHVPKIVGRQGLETFRQRFGKDVPFYLAAKDQLDPGVMEVLPPYDKFIDPAGSDDLKDFGIETIPFPGHTEGGSLYWYPAMNMMFVGGKHACARRSLKTLNPTSKQIARQVL